MLNPRAIRNKHLNMNARNEPFFKAAVNAAKTRTYRAAVSAGLSHADRDDLFQEIILDLLQRAPQFDPDKGSEGTFTGLVSQNRTADFLSNLTKDRQRLIPRSEQDAANEDDLTASAKANHKEDAPMWMEDPDRIAWAELEHDIETARAYMTGEQRELLELLSAHKDLPSAATSSGMSNATFYRRVDDLQMHLRMFGIRMAA